MAATASVPLLQSAEGRCSQCFTRNFPAGTGMANLKTPPIGYCIYCGASDPEANLQDEHAIPYGMGGHYTVLRKASCERCAKITCSIEQYCLRRLFLNARVHLNMPTRRPKERPRALPVYIIDAGEKKPRYLPIEEHPLVIKLPVLDAPPILRGMEGSEWVLLKHPFVWEYVGFRENPQQKMDALGECFVDTELAPTHLCLLLAKIAHCCAVGSIGFGRFEAFLPELIITESNSVCDYVGGCEKPLFPDRNASVDVMVRNEPEFIIVQICLFASLGAPYYQVVVGRGKQ